MNSCFHDPFPEISWMKNFLNKCLFPVLNLRKYTGEIKENVGKADLRIVISDERFVQI